MCGVDSDCHIIGFQNYPVQTEDSGADSSGGTGIQVTSIDSRDLTNYPLAIKIGAAGVIYIHFSYHHTVFTKEFIETLAGHFHDLMDTIAEAPFTTIDEINLAEADEQQPASLLQADFNF